MTIYGTSITKKKFVLTPFGSCQFQNTPEAQSESRNALAEPARDGGRANDHDNNNNNNNNNDNDITTTTTTTNTNSNDNSNSI